MVRKSLRVSWFRPRSSLRTALSNKIPPFHRGCFNGPARTITAVSNGRARGQDALCRREFRPSIAPQRSLCWLDAERGDGLRLGCLGECQEYPSEAQSQHDRQGMTVAAHFGIVCTPHAAPIRVCESALVRACESDNRAQPYREAGGAGRARGVRERLAQLTAGDRSDKN
jgi:hypothetical protein